MSGERRVPVQGEHFTHRGRPPGTVPWSTHEEAWRGYDAAGHGSQSAERIAERGGFSYRELQCAIAGHYNDAGRCNLSHPEPTGWEPVR